jgi:2-polyprenyl-3-methyl-5-hydroxy-6-metoxy-1,4-benzoquinol methylase
MKNLTSSKYWSEKHPQIERAIMSDSFHNLEYLYPKLDKLLKAKKGAKIIELGCAPGQGLRKISERYSLIPNGCDFVQEIDIVAKIFKKLFPSSKFFKCDLSKQAVEGRYEIVMSGGLIEHFDDVEMIVRKHVGAAKSGGILIINTPNLSFLRALFWRIFDPFLLKGHNPKATNKKYVGRLLQNNGCRLIDSGYFGKPHIWVEHPDVLGAQRATIIINKLLRKLGLKNVITMPFVYWIAIKN